MPEPETAHDRGDAERPIEHPIGSIGMTVLKFDVSDWMLRRHGQDPYASVKLAQLDAPARSARSSARCTAIPSSAAIAHAADGKAVAITHRDRDPSADQLVQPFNAREK